MGAFKLAPHFPANLIGLDSRCEGAAVDLAHNYHVLASPKVLTDTGLKQFVCGVEPPVAAVAVHRVLRGRAFAEVRPSVIRRVAIDMVYDVVGQGPALAHDVKYDPIGAAASDAWARYVVHRKFAPAFDISPRRQFMLDAAGAVGPPQPAERW